MGRTTAAWRVELPPPRHRRLGDFRVAVWTQSSLCEIDASVAERLSAATAALARAGASLDETARPPIDDEDHQRAVHDAVARGHRLADERR